MKKNKESVIDLDEQEKKDFFKFFYNEMDKTLKNHNLASIFSADYYLNENNSDKKEFQTGTQAIRSVREEE